MPCFLQHLTGFTYEKLQLWYDPRMKSVSKDRKSIGQFVLLYLVYALHCVYVCVCIVSVCLVRCSRGRTTAPTPVGEAQTQSRGRQHHPSSQALSSGIRLSPKKRRPKSPARRLPSSPPAPRGRSVAQTFTLCFSLCPTGSVKLLKWSSVTRLWHSLLHCTLICTGTTSLSFSSFSVTNSEW